MSRPLQCASCQHGKDKHGPNGCTARTTLDGLRDPKTGRCLCRCFKGAEFSPERRKAIHLGQLKACFAEGRAR